MIWQYYICHTEHSRSRPQSDPLPGRCKNAEKANFVS